MLKESKVRSEACDGETDEETAAADTQREKADEATQEDSSTQNSIKKKKKKKRKLNEAEDPANICELFLGAHNIAWHDDAQLEH